MLYNINQVLARAFCPVNYVFNKLALNIIVIDIQKLLKQFRNNSFKCDIATKLL